MFVRHLLFKSYIVENIYLVIMTSRLKILSNENDAYCLISNLRLFCFQWSDLARKEAPTLLKSKIVIGAMGFGLIRFRSELFYFVSVQSYSIETYDVMAPLVESYGVVLDEWWVLYWYRQYMA